MAEVMHGRWMPKPGCWVIARLDRWEERVDRYGRCFFDCDFVASKGKCRGMIWPGDAATKVPANLQKGGWHLVVMPSAQWGSRMTQRFKAIIPIVEVFTWLGKQLDFESDRYRSWKRLDRWFRQIPNSIVQAFVLLTFLNKRLRDAFFEVPASREHHHSWSGGLAEHSIEVAEHVATNALIRDSNQRWLASVAGLFHDIGKVRTLHTERDVRRKSEILGHDCLTLETLAPSLAWLDQFDSESGQVLRYLLTWDPTRQPRPLLPTAMAVKEADRLSAGLSAYEMTFDSAPAWARFASLDVSGPRNRFWRPKAQVPVLSQAR